MSNKVFNPLKEDFTTTFDVSGEGKPQPFTAFGMEITTFPSDVIATHMKKHLANHIMFTRTIKTNAEDELKAIMQEVSA